MAFGWASDQCRAARVTMGLVTRSLTGGGVVKAAVLLRAMTVQDAVESEQSSLLILTILLKDQSVPT